MSPTEENAREWWGNLVCLLIIVAVVGFLYWRSGEVGKPDDCNTINHTRPFDGAPCFPRHYDRSRRPG